MQQWRHIFSLEIFLEKATWSSTVKTPSEPKATKCLPSNIILASRRRRDGHPQTFIFSADRSWNSEISISSTQSHRRRSTLGNVGTRSS
jgi:hypothetical protein